MVFIYKMKSRSSDNIIYAKLYMKKKLYKKDSINLNFFQQNLDLIGHFWK